MSTIKTKIILIAFSFLLVDLALSLPQIQDNGENLLDLLKNGGTKEVVSVNKNEVEKSLNGEEEIRTKRQADELRDLLKNGGITEVANIDTDETKRILEKGPETSVDRQKREYQRKKPQPGKKRRPSKSRDNSEDNENDEEAEDFVEFFNKIKNQNDDDVKYGLEKTMKPMKCVLKKFANIKFLGTLTGIAEEIDTEDICGGICYQFNFEGGHCKSVNYLKNTRKCELMSDVFDTNNEQLNKYIKYYIENNRQSLYVIPSSCKQEGEPEVKIPKSASQSTIVGNSSLSGTCGKTLFPNRVAKSSASNPSTRIVGGTEARPHSMPWIISISENGSPFCGGSLLRCNNKEESRLILTAAHCIKQPGRWSDLDPRDLTVGLGEHSLQNKDQGEQKLRVQTFEFNSKYDEETSANDIAVVQLKTPVQFSQTIQPVCLPSPTDKLPAPGTKCVVAGWGTTSEGGRQSDKLMQVISPILSDTDCADPKFYGNEFMPDKMFCAGYKEGQKDSCQGDSGGPYVCYDGDAAKLFGVVSFGIGCAREAKPGVYARVINYLPWINEMKAKYCA